LHTRLSPQSYQFLANLRGQVSDPFTSLNVKVTVALP
jgi:hypothetical protein